MAAALAPEARNYAFVANFVSSWAPSSSPSPKELKSSGGEGVDFATLCKNLVNAAGPTVADQLYGKEIRSQVDEWLTFASNCQADRDRVSVSTYCRTLDTYLLSRAVMLGTGTAIGLADIAIFVSVHDEVAALSVEELNSYRNLLRWIDFVQNKYDESHAYSWIPVVKPKFDPPVLSPESESKKATSAPQGASVKDKVANGAAVIPPDQQKAAPKAQEEKGKSDPLPDKKGAVQADGAKGNQKEKKAKPETVSVGDDAKKGQQKEKKEPAPAEKDAFGLEILDIKVGVIKSVKKHPTADTLYVEDIDIGEGSVRQVVSGLAKYLTEDQMLNRRVLVLANVKPSKLRDVMSAGLVLCTSNDDHSQCEPVIPPKEAKIGERVTAEGYDGKPEAVLNPKKKQWDKIYPDLHTDDAGVACYKGKPLTTSAGPCTSSIIKGTIK
ncbi:unnamed protein product [Calypogeia fissa]